MRSDVTTSSPPATPPSVPPPSVTGMGGVVGPVGGVGGVPASKVLSGSVLPQATKGTTAASTSDVPKTK
jgi:hypothetical protein